MTDGAKHPDGSLLSALSSRLATPEQMTWIHDRFKPDSLERLSRADRDYCDAHGNYLPDVAILAHAALEEVGRLAAVAEAAQQFRSVFYVDDHEYGKRARETYQAIRALDLALEALRG